MADAIMTTHNEDGDAREAVTLAKFKSWLQSHQNAAAAAMTAATGDAFGKHCAALADAIDAARVVALFEREWRA